MQRTTMLALGLLRTLNRFRLCLQEATTARRDIPRSSYDTNQIDIGIAWHFSLDVFIHQKKRLRNGDVGQSEDIFAHATEKVARTSPSPVTAIYLRLSSV